MMESIVDRRRGARVELRSTKKKKGDQIQTETKREELGFHRSERRKEAVEKKKEKREKRN